MTALGWTTLALGVVAVLCGLLVFRLDSMARVTFLLLASFVAVAADVAALGLGYLGVVIILMMTVEMVIMVVFMVMLMMNPAGLMPMTMVHNAWGARAVALVVFGVLAAGALLVPWPTSPRATPPPDPTAALGDALMGPQMLVMMTLGLALLGTIVGTVALSVPRGRYSEDDDARPDGTGAARPDGTGAARPAAAATTGPQVAEGAEAAR